MPRQPRCSVPAGSAVCCGAAAPPETACCSPSSSGPACDKFASNVRPCRAAPCLLGPQSAAGQLLRLRLLAAVPPPADLHATSLACCQGGTWRPVESRLASLRLRKVKGWRSIGGGGGQCSSLRCDWESRTVAAAGHGLPVGCESCATAACLAALAGRRRGPGQVQGS